MLLIINLYNFENQEYPLVFNPIRAWKPFCCHIVYYDEYSCIWPEIRLSNTVQYKVINDHGSM